MGFSSRKQTLEPACRFRVGHPRPQPSAPPRAGLQGPGGRVGEARPLGGCDGDGASGGWSDRGQGDGGRGGEESDRGLGPGIPDPVLPAAATVHAQRPGSQQRPQPAARSARPPASARASRRHGRRRVRALGAKGPGWLRRGPWAAAAGFCNRGGRGRAASRGRDPPARGSGDGIRSIVLSNPKKRNALSLAMLKSLQKDILHEAESQDLKVIVISAEGPVFSSGHDLKELTDEQGPDYHAEVFRTCSEVMMMIQNHPVPVIAMVNGLATAAGCQLVASCDIAVASDKSSFATPGVNIGLFCSTPGVALGRAVPRKVALEMLFTGEAMSAQEALLHGLLSRVVPEERLEEETMRIARKVASLSRPVVSLGKAAFYRQLAQDLRTAYHLASQTMVDNLGLPDGQEGIKAFLQKRKPVWSHRVASSEDPGP
nr:enoyl-CoA hydratase domain-containing protein 3, mitochondrial [Camelus dromedarius]